MYLKRNLLLLLLLPVLVFAQKPTRVITDADIPEGSHVTFSADTVYILDGMVFVDRRIVRLYSPR